MFLDCAPPCLERESHLSMLSICHRHTLPGVSRTYTMLFGSHGCFSGSHAVSDTVSMNVYFFWSLFLLCMHSSSRLVDFAVKVYFPFIEGAWYVYAACLMMLAIAKMSRYAILAGTILTLCETSWRCLSTTCEPSVILVDPGFYTGL